MGFEKCIKKKIDIYIRTEEMTSSTIPGWKRVFIDGVDEKVEANYDAVRDIIYQNQHIFGRSSSDEFFALAAWDYFGVKEIFTLYKGVTFPSLNFSNVNQAKSKVGSHDFLIEWTPKINLIWKKKEIEVLLMARSIHFDPVKFLSESQNYSGRTSGRDLSEAIRSILR